jgi:hypothetical protein
MDIKFYIKIKACLRGLPEASLGNLRQISLWINGYQLLFGSSHQGRLFGCFGRRLGIKSIEDRGANKDGKKESHDVHSGTEEKRLPAADCVKGSAIHWILD